MLGDKTGQISRNFDVLIEEEGLAERGTFVINPAGKIVVMEHHDSGIGRDASELLRKVEAAQYVDAHPDQSAPPSGVRARKRWFRPSISWARSNLPAAPISETND